MIKIDHSSLWLPDYVADTVTDIDVDRLKCDGITHIVFDLDKTLVYRNSNDIPMSYLRYIQSLKDAGLQILIGSNTRRDIDSITKSLAAEAVRFTRSSFKPLPSFYERIWEKADVMPDRIAMAGDHIVNDIFGANRAGFTTILVKALHPRTSALYRAYVRHVLTKSESNT